MVTDSVVLPDRNEQWFDLVLAFSLLECIVNSNLICLVFVLK